MPYGSIEMQKIQTLLDPYLVENSLHSYLVAVGIFLGLLLLLYIVRWVVQARVKSSSKKHPSPWDAYVFQTMAATRFWFFLAVAFYGGTRSLKLAEKTDHYLSILIGTLVLLQVALWGNALITRYLKRYRETHFEENAAMVTTMAVLGFIARLTLYSFILLLILENAGINVTALFAGLGIGGVAVALAAQNILGDLFASLAIAFDKPFVLGDFIICDDITGTIEKIGMKTTRIRSLGGEQIVLPNSKLVSNRIRNYKRMQERRILFGVGVTYQTPSEKLERIPGMIKTIIEAQSKARFDRAHFKGFGGSSLDFEIVYYILSPDYNEYMDVQQTLNLEIFKAFEREGIDFAYPTQTLFVEPTEVKIDELKKSV